MQVAYNPRQSMVVVKYESGTSSSFTLSPDVATSVLADLGRYIANPSNRAEGFIPAADSAVEELYSAHVLECAARMNPAKPGVWRYSLTWVRPLVPCPGAKELAAVDVPLGACCPPELMALWRPLTGYAICLDFPPPGPPRRWSAEAKSRVRRSRLVKRVEKRAPLFADELVERELAARPSYFNVQETDNEEH